MTHAIPRNRVAAANVDVHAQARSLLDSVSVEAKSGQMIGLVGPNGAGKTTLLRALSGLLEPDHGEILIDGQPLRDLSQREISKALAHVAQLAPDTHGFTALEIAMMGRYAHMGRFEVEGRAHRDAALRALAKTDTVDLADREMSTLSGGERQRVFLARGLAQAPLVLLLDEPTSNLDIQHQVQTLGTIRELVQEGLTAVAAIHDLELAARYCDRLVLLSHGRVVAEGPPAAVLSSANIEAAFGVRCLTSRDPMTGALVLTPLERPIRVHGAHRGLRVHVVCGGGSGAHVLYRLVLHGYRVTAGPLGDGDTDAEAARSLGIDYVRIPAFADVSPGAHERHLEMARTAEIAVLCEVPFGRGNVVNLEALSLAPERIGLGLSSLAERDFSGGRAGEIAQRLEWSQDCRNVDELLNVLGSREPSLGKVP